jgi:hypothetical protein
VKPDSPPPRRLSKLENHTSSAVIYEYPIRRRENRDAASNHQISPILALPLSIQKPIFASKHCQSKLKMITPLKLSAIELMAWDSQ